MARRQASSERGRRLGSVRLRITLATAALFAVALSVAAVWLVRTVESGLIDEVEADDRAVLEGLAEDLARGDVPEAFLDPAELEETFGDLSGELGDLLDDAAVAPPDFEGSDPFLFALGPGLEELFGGRFGSTSDGAPSFDADALVEDLRESLAAYAEELLYDDDAHAVHDDLALTELGVPTDSGTVSLVAASPLEDVRRSVDTVERALWVVIPVLVVLIGAAAWFTTGRALRPVGAITSRVDDIGASTLHERVPEPRSRDEVAHLAGTMNAMLGRLEDAATRQRQFVSDASHELRSPVAAIRTELEVALRDPDGADWPDVAASVLAEDERLERIVGDLLALARFDERTDGAEGEEVDLDEIVLDEVARTRGTPVDASRVGAGRVVGRRGDLASMVRHLVDNAARHAASQVQVTLSSAEGQVLLAVDDDGPGIAEPDRERVFERFGRLEEARTRDAGGAGLGLAVVRQVAERCGGQVRVTDSELGGARLEVLLPQPD